MSRPPFALVAVVGLLAAGLGVAQATHPEPKRGTDVTATRLEPVVGKLVVCPELLRSGSDVKTRLTAGVVDEGEVVVRAAPLTPGSTGLGRVVLDEGGHVGPLDVTSDQSIAVAVTAAGEESGGLEVEQFSRGADGPQRGYANVRCEPTEQDTWFVGGSTEQYAESELVLVNPYDENALANLEIYGDDGRIETPSAEGLVVRPRSRQVVKLADVAPDERALAVRVVTLEGRIAAAMRDSRAKLDTPLGADWVPRAGQPRTQLDLTALPPGVGRRLLHLFAPGEDDAVVRVQVTLADGQFVPEGLEEVEVPAGRVVTVDLTKAIGTVDQRTAIRNEAAASVRVLAEGAPVFAVGFAENNARFSEIREFAYVGAVGPLTGPSLVTEIRTDHKIESTIYFAAPDGQARVAVQAVPRRGIVAGNLFRQEFTIAPGKLVPLSVHLRYPISDLRSLVVTPLDGSAPVYAGRLLFERGARGPLVTMLGLVTQPASGVPVAEVESSPLAALVDPRVQE